MLRTQAYIVAIATALFLAGCAGLGSMEKAIETLNIKVNPETLIIRGDIVEVEITGNFPAKYFAKKVRLEATPVLVWDGGEAAFATHSCVATECGSYLRGPSVWIVSKCVSYPFKP